MRILAIISWLMIVLGLAGPAMAQGEGGGNAQAPTLEQVLTIEPGDETLTSNPQFTQWWVSLEACNTNNRTACNRAVDLAATLFERTHRNVATTWMKTCLAGDDDRCEIGYRRFRNVRFPDDNQPIAHMFARASCFAGMYDLCRPWDDFETTDENKRALVMASVCLTGASPNTCYRALGHFRDESGLYSAVTYDLAEKLCDRYQSGSACRTWAQVLEANWDPDRAYRWHNFSCQQGLQESCPDAARLKRGVDYRARQAEARAEAERRLQAAVERGRSYRPQLTQQGYNYTPQARTPTTPFGSSSRDVENWRRYERNLCLGNPVNRYC